MNRQNGQLMKRSRGARQSSKSRVKMRRNPCAPIKLRNVSPNLVGKKQRSIQAGKRRNQRSTSQFKSVKKKNKRKKSTIKAQKALAKGVKPVVLFDPKRRPRAGESRKKRLRVAGKSRGKSRKKAQRVTQKVFHCKENGSHVRKLVKRPRQKFSQQNIEKFYNKMKKMARTRKQAPDANSQSRPRLTEALVNQRNGYFSRQKHDFSVVDKEVRSILLRRKSRSRSRLRPAKSKKKKLLRIVSQKGVRKRTKATGKKAAKGKRGTSKAKREKRDKEQKSPKARPQKARKKKIQVKVKEAQLVRQGPRKPKEETTPVDKLKLSGLCREPRKLSSTVSLKQIMKITNQIKKKTSQYGIQDELGKLVDDLRKMVQALDCGSADESQNKSSSGNVMNYNINNFQNINNIRNLKWERRPPANRSQNPDQLQCGRQPATRAVLQTQGEALRSATRRGQAQLLQEPRADSDRPGAPAARCHFRV